MLELAPVGQRIGPARPRLDFEFADAIGAVLAHEIVYVALRSERDVVAAGFYPCLESVDQHHPARRRRGRGEQDRMIATGANSADGSGSKSAQPVGLQPLSRIVSHPQDL